MATSFDVHVLDFTINDAAMILADKAAQHVASMATPRSQTDVETLLLEKGFGALVAELPVAVRTDVRKVAILGATCALALYHVKSYNPNNPAKVSGTSTHPATKGSGGCMNLSFSYFHFSKVAINEQVSSSRQAAMCIIPWAGSRQDG